MGQLCTSGQPETDKEQKSDESINIDNNIQRWRKELREILETRYGLLDELLSRSVLSAEQVETVRDGSNIYKQCDLLLDIINSKSPTECLTFIEALRLTDQVHVANFIEQNGRAGFPFECWPLDGIRKRRIELNMRHLVEFIDPENGLVAQMLAAHCINMQQKEDIEQPASRSEKNRKLLNIIQRRSAIDFNSFLKCLRNTAQYHVVELLRTDGVTESIDVTLDGSSIAVIRETEDRIVGPMLAAARSMNEQERQKFYDELSSVIHRYVHQDIDIVYAETGHSIRCYLLCRSVAALRFLYISIENGSIKMAIQLVFRTILDVDDGGPTVLRVTSSLNFGELKHRMAEMRNFLEQIQKYNRSLAANQQNQIQGTPAEIIEMILLKAVAAMFRYPSSLTSRPDVMAIRTLNSVCRLWWHTIVWRRFNRRRLRRFLSRLRFPYRFHPPLSATIQTKANVWGLTVAGGCIFVAGNKLGVIYVHADCAPSYERLYEIQVDGLRDPTDIIACQQTGRLFIADASYRNKICSMKLSTEGEPSSRWFNVAHRVWSFSLKSGRLLVTPYTSELFIYTTASSPTGDGDAKDVPEDDEMKPSKRVPLPDFINPRHAVETQRNTFVVAHVGWLRDDEHDQISEVDDEGHVLRSYGGERGRRLQQLNEPWYVAVVERQGDKVDQSDILVADRWNRRLVVLDWQLTFKRILLTSAHDCLNERPERMWYETATGRLLVGQGNHINDYQILQ